MTKNNSFEEEIDHYLRELKNHADKGDNLIRVLVGNKIDLCIDDPKSRQVPREEINKKIEEIPEKMRMEGEISFNVYIKYMG